MRNFTRFCLLVLVALAGTHTLNAQLKAGDLVFVAYRMNATATEDEVALLTFVDIPAGTVINFTDSKYTTNTTPQCPDGLKWTSPSTCLPAGTVFTIKTNVPSTSAGTIKGSAFGLSSSGDQVIVYTDTNTSPTYITALSSNAWVATNTSCSGSNSKLPAGLTDGQTSLNTSTAPGNTSGNTVNAYYSGTQSGATGTLRTAILNPANWTGIGSATAAQTWPTWSFPGPPVITGNKVTSSTTVQVFFNRDLDNTTATNTANFTGLSGLSSITRTNNGALADTLTLTYTTAFTVSTSNTVTVMNVKDADGNAIKCAITFTFTYTGGPTAIQNADKNAVVKMYPNPAASMVTIEYATATDAVFEVYDMAGKKMLSQTLETASNLATVSTTHLTSGIYFTRLVVDGNAIEIGKLIIIK